MSSQTPRPPQATPLPPGGPRHGRTSAEPTSGDSTAPSQSPLQQRLQGAFLTIIGIAGIFGGVLFAIEAPRFTPVPVVFLSFWLVMVIVGRILFTGLNKLRSAGVGAPAPQQVRGAAAVAGIVVAVGMMGFAATGAGAGSAQAAPCPGGGPATCGPDPGAPTLTFTPPPAQTNAPGGQQGQQGGQDQQGIATSPAQGGDNGPGIQAQTPQFGTPGQQAPNIPGNEQPGQSGQQQPQQQDRGPVRTTAPGQPQQTGQQTNSSGATPSQPTVTVTQTQSQCPAPGVAGNGAPGAPGSSGGDGGPGASPDGGGDDSGAPSWAYLVGESSALLAGRRRPGGGSTGGSPSPEPPAEPDVLGDAYAVNRHETQSLVTPYGPYTPEQEKTNEAVEAVNNLVNQGKVPEELPSGVADLISQGTQPDPGLDPAQMIEQSLDEQEQQQVTNQVMAPVTEAQKPAMQDPVGEILEQVGSETEPQPDSSYWDDRNKERAAERAQGITELGKTSGAAGDALKTLVNQDAADRASGAVDKFAKEGGKLDVPDPSREMKFLGRVGSIARKGGYLGTALSATTDVMSGNKSLKDAAGNAAASTAGGVALGAIGSLAGPLGTAAGSYVGSTVGGWLYDNRGDLSGGAKRVAGNVGSGIKSLGKKLFG